MLISVSQNDWITLLIYNSAIHLLYAKKKKKEWLLHVPNPMVQVN